MRVRTRKLASPAPTARSTSGKDSKPRQPTPARLAPPRTASRPSTSPSLSPSPPPRSSPSSARSRLSSSSSTPSPPLPPLPLSPPTRALDDSDRDSPLSTPPLSLYDSPSPARVLLLVDVQRGPLSDPPLGVPGAKALRRNLLRVLACARAARPPPLIVHVRNTGEEGDLDAPGQPGWELWTDVREGEVLIDKRKNNAFAGTKLEELVGRDAEVVVVGCSSDFGIRATCGAALERRNPVLLIRGAHGTYDRHALYAGGAATPAHLIEREVEQQLEREGAALIDVGEAVWIFQDR